MKRKLLTLLMMTSVIAMLTGCGDSQDDSKKDETKQEETKKKDKSDKKDKNKDEEISEEANTEESDEPELPGYYIQTVDMAQGSKSDENFGIQFTTAGFNTLNLDDCMNYVASDGYVVDVAEYDSYPTLQEFLEESTTVVHPGREEKVCLFDSEISNHRTGDSYDRYDNFAKLMVCNYSNDDLTLKECFDKNWVYMEMYYSDVMSDTYTWDDGEDLYKLMVDEAGTPDSLIMSGVTSASTGEEYIDIENNTEELVKTLFTTGAPVIGENDDYKINITFYYMAYDFGDSVFALLVEDENKGKNYGYNCQLEINSAYVFTKECYEEYKVSRTDDDYYFISYDEIMNVVAK